MKHIIGLVLWTIPRAAALAVVLTIVPLDGLVR